MRDNNREAYEEFFSNFGRGLKYGIYTSYGMNKDTLADLLLFYSAKEQKMVTLAEYAAAAPEGQEAVYYAAGESVERLAKMPIVTTVLGRGHDVLLCTQDVDEFCMSAMADYAVPDADDPDSLTAWPFKNVAGGDLGLESEEEKKEAEAAAEENKGLFEAMKGSARRQGGEGGGVHAPDRRAGVHHGRGPAVAGNGEDPLRHAGRRRRGEDAARAGSEREAPGVDVLKAAQEAGDADKVKLYADILYNQALLVEGLPIEDPVAYAQAVTQLMK